MFFNLNKRFYEAPEDGSGSGDGTQQGAGSTDNQGTQQGENEADKRLKALEETLSKMQSNFDRKNTEFQKLAKENEELKKAQMKEEERREYEKQQYEKQLKDRESAIEQKELELQKVQIMSAKGIPADLGSMIKGNTAEEYQKNIDLVAEKMEAEIKSRVEKAINDKLGGAKPPGTGGGEPAKGKALLIQQYNEAEKRGDAITMLRLQEQIKKYKE